MKSHRGITENRSGDFSRPARNRSRASVIERFAVSRLVLIVLVVSFSASPTEAGPTAYSGLYTTGSGPYAFYSYTSWAALEAKRVELARSGRHLVEFDSHQNGRTKTFTGVWAAANGASRALRTRDWSAFEAEWKRNRAQLRLVDLDITRIDGELWFTGLWSGSGGAQELVHDLDWNDFVARWRVLSGDGMRLRRVEMYTKDGETRLSGIYDRPEKPGSYALYAHKSWQAFSAQHTKLGDGLALIDYGVHEENGTKTYIGVWGEAPATHFLIRERNWQSFVGAWKRYSNEGLRLRSVEVESMASTTPLYGIADLHNHQHANLGFGGRMLHGAAWSEGGISEALGRCGRDGVCTLPNELSTCQAGCRLAESGCQTGCLAGCSDDCAFDWLVSDLDCDTCQKNCVRDCKQTSCRNTCTSSACECTKPGKGPCCTSCVHGPGGALDLIGSSLGEGNGEGSHDVGGYPDFEGWPSFTTYTHQQVYHEWLKRAYQGGMRLMVMLAVNNEILCRTANTTSLTKSPRSCDDMTAVEAQIQAAKDLERFIDRQNDGSVNGNGWYRIAKSSAEARRIIEDDALAVVLGVEVDNLFGCTRRADCTPFTVKRELGKLYESGVRHLFPVHVFDNGFGGAAVYNDLFAAGNVATTGTLYDIENCSNRGYEFALGKDEGLHPIIDHFRPGFRVRDVAPGAHCNRLGLTSLGEVLVDTMMDRGMMIDVDHMSRRMRDSVLDRAERRRYAGVVAGHAAFTELYQESPEPKLNHEGNLTRAEVRRIHALGGMMAPIHHQGGTRNMTPHTRTNGGPTVAETCGNSARSWAQAYLYAVDNAGGGAVGMGSDFNGLAGQPGPRFGPHACGGDVAASQGSITTHGVKYPVRLHDRVRLGSGFGRHKAGNKTFDINTDGLAHVGLLPDFVAELRSLGLNDRQLDPLFRSANAYLKLWERSERSAVDLPSIAPILALSTLGYQAGGWRVERHPRLMGDVNGDGRDDIVGFGTTAVILSLATGPRSFSQPTPVLSRLVYKDGWRIDKHPRLLGDVNGDGKADIVAFSSTSTLVALSTGTGFSEPKLWSSSFGYAGGWRTEKHERRLVDVNGDGRDDIVAFGNVGVHVALSTGTKFSPATTAIKTFGFNQGWRRDRHPRLIGDVNGDGRPDIVAMGTAATFLSLGTGSGFGPHTEVFKSFSYDSTWRVPLHPRMLADVNGDGREDIVGFGTKQVVVALSTGTGFSTPTAAHEGFDHEGGWRVGTHLRFVTDVNGDGRADLIGFGTGNVVVALSNGNQFAATEVLYDTFTPKKGWQVQKHPRVLADTDGDGRPEIVGFGDAGVYVGGM